MEKLSQGKYTLSHSWVLNIIIFIFIFLIWVKKRQRLTKRGQVWDSEKEDNKLALCGLEYKTPELRVQRL